MSNEHTVHDPGASADSSVLATTLSSFDARLKQLEKPEEKTRLAWIQKRMSFIALAVGILLSCISLYDIFWSKPKEALFRDMQEFNKSVNAVADLRQDMIELQYQSTNPQMVMAVHAMIMPQILANIQYATALLQRLEEHAGIPQLIVLISEAMNIYDWKSAGILVDRAIAAKDAVPSLQSEARRYKGRLLFVTGKMQAGRQAYEDALNVLRNEAAFGINATRAYIVADWAVMEFSLGDCHVGNERVHQFIELVGHPQIAPPARTALVATLAGQLQAYDKRCAVPAELKSLS